MLSRCLLGHGWGVEGVEGVGREVEEAGGRNGARVGSARRPATLDAQRSTLNRNADAERQRQRRQVQRPASDVQSPDERRAGRVSGAAAEGSGPSGPRDVQARNAPTRAGGGWSRLPLLTRASRALLFHGLCYTQRRPSFSTTHPPTNPNPPNTTRHARRPSDPHGARCRDCIDAAAAMIRHAPPAHHHASILVPAFAFCAFSRAHSLSLPSFYVDAGRPSPLQSSRLSIPFSCLL
jgi:hypothetical protein